MWKDPWFRHDILSEKFGESIISISESCSNAKLSNFVSNRKEFASF